MFVNIKVLVHPCPSLHSCPPFHTCPLSGVEAEHHLAYLTIEHTKDGLASATPLLAEAPPLEIPRALRRRPHPPKSHTSWGIAPAVGCQKGTLAHNLYFPRARPAPVRVTPPTRGFVSAHWALRCQVSVHLAGLPALTGSAPEAPPPQKPRPVRCAASRRRLEPGASSANGGRGRRAGDAADGLS